MQAESMIASSINDTSMSKQRKLRESVHSVLEDYNEPKQQIALPKKKKLKKKLEPIHEDSDDFMGIVEKPQTVEDGLDMHELSRNDIS